MVSVLFNLQIFVTKTKFCSKVIARIDPAQNFYFSEFFRDYLVQH